MRINLFSFKKTDAENIIEIIDQKGLSHKLCMDFITCDCDEFL